MTGRLFDVSPQTPISARAPGLPRPEHFLGLFDVPVSVSWHSIYRLQIQIRNEARDVINATELRAYESRSNAGLVYLTARSLILEPVPSRIGGCKHQTIEIR